jgi:hypothetical protein
LNAVNQSSTVVLEKPVRIKSMKSITSIVIAVAVAAGSARRAAAVSNDVFVASATITRSVLAIDNPTNGVFRNAIIYGKDLVNLARGRNLGTALPSNEVLAIAHTCGASNATLMVYDRYATNNLQTIAEFARIVAANVPHRHSNTAQTLWSMDWASTSGVSNALQGGQCLLISTSLNDTNGCFQSLSGTAEGWFQAVVTPTMGTDHTPTNTTMLIQRMGIAISSTPIGHLAP